PTPPGAAAVAWATMVAEDASSAVRCMGAPGDSRRSARGGRVTAGRLLHDLAVLLDVALHVRVIEVQVAQHAGEDGEEGGGRLISAEPEAHLEHRGAEHLVLQFLGLTHLSLWSLWSRGAIGRRGEEVGRRRHLCRRGVAGNRVAGAVGAPLVTGTGRR